MLDQRVRRHVDLFVQVGQGGEEGRQRLECRAAVAVFVWSFSTPHLTSICLGAAIIVTASRLACRARAAGRCRRCGAAPAGGARLAAAREGGAPSMARIAAARSQPAAQNGARWRCGWQGLA